MDYILFDLDGTITNSYNGIINSIVYSLKKFGIEVEDKSKLSAFIGPPLLNSFETYFGFSEAKATDAVKFYREYYSDKGIFENSVYDGVVPLLKSLKAAGKKIILATSKPEAFAEKCLDHFKLCEYFDTVAGATFDQSRVSKTDVISYALEKGKVLKSSAVMVGDRKHDILGAKAHGLKSVGVLYGYGDRTELESAGADYIAESPQDILKIVI